MSLVAYGSSDESSEDEGSTCDTESITESTEKVTVKETNGEFCLRAAKQQTEEVKDINVNDERIHFDKLPKPKSLSSEPESIVEDDDIPPKKEIELKPEKPIKKDRAPVRITIPSLSDFKDLDEETEKKSNRIRSSDKGTKLFALLPPPKAADVKRTKSLIPSAVNKAAAKANQIKDPFAKNTPTKNANTSKVTVAAAQKSSIGITYDSNSEDEDDTTMDGGSHSHSSSSTTDFFALAATETVPIPVIADPLSSTHLKDYLSDPESGIKKDSNEESSKHDYKSDSSTTSVGETCVSNSQKMLVSNVMNLPKEEILLKNKAEVGPKLPVPEQEYNVDTEGNVAFDDKAIEYLCGKRGIKRKNKEFEEANIIEINGEDIKPDEREWLVKALTEEPIQRPVSMQGGGVSSQSKKKHQITYLAHQAKAMEMELKNQWAQNRMTRKQTQSKYGF